MSINLNDAWWLSVRQMRDNWTAYLYSAIYFVFMGFVLAADDSWAMEFALPILMFIVMQPSVSARYMTMKKDNEVARHQIFLHSLPIGFSTIIFARVIGMLAAGLINVPLLFLPFWFIDSRWSSLGNYLAWCAFWIGMGLIGAGIALIQEFWLSMREWVRLNFVVVIVAVALLIVLMAASGIRPVNQTVELSHRSPWILAAGGLTLGILALWRSTVLAVYGFRKREFAT